MAVIFPDIEQILVAHLKSVLPNTVRVATKKAPADQTQPAQQVVIVGNYTGTLDDVRQEATVTIDVFATDYKTASDLARTVAALVVEPPMEHIKRATVVLGPVRLADSGPDEKRSLSVELIVKGSNL